MSRSYDRPILLQRINEDTEKWEDLLKLHASINRTKKDTENTTSGAERSKRSLTFELRYFPDLEKIAYNTQFYRIVYQGVTFNIVDYDDYMLSHKTVRLSGVSYGG